MTYAIEGLKRAQFEPLAGLGDTALAERGAMRVKADRKPGYPCRVSLRDAEPGESLILLNFVSHDVPTPFRTAYAIYVREEAEEAPRFEDEVPDYLDSRMLSLRGFDRDGMLRNALIAAPGEADAGIRTLFGEPEVATIHAHAAAYGCFLARIERN